MSGNIEILLGIITCKRPNLLSELLESITRQTIFSTDIKVSVVVVDNDLEQSGEQVFVRFKDMLPCPAEYLTETQRGIPFARNKVLEYARNIEAKNIAFIDDDETASPEWLLTLYKVQKTNGVDAVQGKVSSILPEGNLPAWAPLAKRKEWNKKEGISRVGLSTNNVIFSHRLITELQLSFNEHFALTGGSDIDFFERAAKLGSKHIWTNKAVVYEKIPRSRLTLQWQFRRLFRASATSTYRSIQERGYTYAILRYLPKVIVRVICGPVLFVTLGLFSNKVLILSVHWTGSALGHTLGFFGIMGNEYSTIHGD